MGGRIAAPPAVHQLCRQLGHDVPVPLRRVRPAQAPARGPFLLLRRRRGDRRRSRMREGREKRPRGEQSGHAGASSCDRTEGTFAAYNLRRCPRGHSLIVETGTFGKRNRDLSARGFS